MLYGSRNILYDKLLHAAPILHVKCYYRSHWILEVRSRSDVAHHVRRFATQLKMAERDGGGDESDSEGEDERVREVTVSDAEDDLEG